MTVAILTASGPAASAAAGHAAAMQAATTPATPAIPATPAADDTDPTTTTTTSTVPPATTTTTTTPPASTTVPAPTTTTTTTPKATTTTKPGTPVTGVPSVPVGGPPTTLPAPGTTSLHAAPADPTQLLTAVQADLSQVSAIQAYGQARAAVANSQEGVAVASTALRAAVATRTQAGAGTRSAQARVDAAANRLRSLAVAAYMGVGVGYVTPAAGPVNDPPGPKGTVTTPGGLAGPAAMDALELLRLVAQHDRKNLTTSRVTLAQLARTEGTAGKGVAQAQAQLASAKQGLSASEQTLNLLTRAATTPGLAATLNLPSPSSAPSSPPAPAPAGATPGPATTTQGSWFVQSDATAPPATSPTILGPSVLGAAELASWFSSGGHKANITVPMVQLAQDYISAGEQTGVRADLAFAQSIVETGYFSFPSYGQLTKADNNFAGIGACDSCAHGWTFPNAATGVSAQLELLEAYASPTPVATPLLGSVGVGGCCPTWMALAGKWASSTAYGISILTVYRQMLTWLIPQRLVAAGLLAAPRPAPTHPTPTAPNPAPAGSGPAPGIIAPTTTTPRTPTTPTTPKTALPTPTTALPTPTTRPGRGAA